MRLVVICVVGSTRFATAAIGAGKVYWHARRDKEAPRALGLPAFGHASPSRSRAFVARVHARREPRGGADQTGCHFVIGHHVPCAARLQLLPWDINDHNECSHPRRTWDIFAAAEGALSSVVDTYLRGFLAHDALAYPGSYVGNIVRTCAVATGYFQGASGVDHLTYCFERDIDPEVTSSSVYFVTRDIDPSLEAESASEPAEWDRGDLRTSWLWNLYEDEWDGSFGGSDGGDTGGGGGGVGGGGGGGGDICVNQVQKPCP